MNLDVHSCFYHSSGVSHQAKLGILFQLLLALCDFVAHYTELLDPGFDEIQTFDRSSEEGQVKRRRPA